MGSVVGGTVVGVVVDVVDVVIVVGATPVVAGPPVAETTPVAVGSSEPQATISEMAVTLSKMAVTANAIRMPRPYRDLCRWGRFDRSARLTYTFGVPVRARPLVAALIAGVLLAGCGGDESASVDSVPPTTASTSTTSAPTTTAAPTTSTTTTTAPELVGAPAFDAASSVSTVGIDRVTFGMTVAQAETELGAEFVAVDEAAGGDCYLVRPAGGPGGVELTVTSNTIERVDITTDLITTRSGAGVGMAETALFELFGDRLSSAPREGGGNTITFTPVDAGDADFRVIFETDGSTVTSFRSGRVPQVLPTRACT